MAVIYTESAQTVTHNAIERLLDERISISTFEESDGIAVGRFGVYQFPRGIPYNSWKTFKYVIDSDTLTIEV